MTVTGGPNYFRAARQAVAAALRQTDFDIFLFQAGGPRKRWPSGSRIQTSHVRNNMEKGHRALSFLMKFEALEACLKRTTAKWVIQADVDAMFVRPTTDDDVRQALEGYRLGMVEQKGIVGSTMNREAFLSHYANYSLAWLSPETPPPPLDTFRYYNSGVVMGLAEEFRRIVPWALDLVHRSGRDHQHGEHMIADQDYFQFWANSLHRDCCKTLPWSWNHCDLWDTEFPRAGARILHFSNFCFGPGIRQIAKMMFYRYFYRLRTLLGGEEEIAVMPNEPAALSARLSQPTGRRLECRRRQERPIFW